VKKERFFRLNNFSCPKFTPCTWRNTKNTSKKRRAKREEECKKLSVWLASNTDANQCTCFNEWNEKENEEKRKERIDRSIL